MIEWRGCTYFVDEVAADIPWRASHAGLPFVYKNADNSYHGWLLGVGVERLIGNGAAVVKHYMGTSTLRRKILQDSREISEALTEPWHLLTTPDPAERENIKYGEASALFAPNVLAHNFGIDSYLVALSRGDVPSIPSADWYHRAEEFLYSEGGSIRLSWRKPSKNEAPEPANNPSGESPEQRRQRLTR